MRIIFGGDSDIAQAIKGEHVLKDNCDVSDLRDVNATFEDFKPLEVVNCAGIICPETKYGYMSEIAINLMGSFHIASNLTKDMKAVFIASTSGLHGRKGWAGYCASKAGVISMVQSLAEDGYQVWCVSPARTKTKMRKFLFPDEDPKTQLKPKDIAKVVEDCFKGKYPTGSNVIVRRQGIEVQN